MVLPLIKEVEKLLSFAKPMFTKNGFRHAQGYISGLIGLGKKTVKKISEALIGEKNHSAISRILTEAKFEKEQLELRYLQKLKYFFKNLEVYLIFDDTLVKREGKLVEETKYHYDHNTDSKIKGHQFFTSVLYTPFLQLPLFPELYSKETHTKIDMAESLIDRVASMIRINTVLFDSWYSDGKLINKCRSMGARVICGVKTNRNIKFKRGRKYWKLSFITDRIPLRDKVNYTIDEDKYKVTSYQIHLHKVPNIKLLISEKYSDKEKSWSKIHLISTNWKDSVEEIISIYKIRWCIETYHRDIKQNLGFASSYFRKESGIVRHSIFVTLAYVILKLYMFRKGVSMTIGECCENLRDKTMNNLIGEIVQTEDRSARNGRFEEVFISKSAKV